MKKLISLFLIFLTIFLFGCTGGVNSSNKNTATVNYHTGTKGLELKFSQNIPDKIYAGTPLDVMVEYSNKGAYNIVGGKLYISGFDSQYIKLNPTSLQNMVAEGKSVFNPDGKISQFVTFTDNSVIIPSDVDRMKQTIKATACYVYRTQASADVCINPKTNNNIREDICQVQPVAISNGQGAPISITRVEEEIYQNKLQFRIYFQNTGGGAVFRPEVIDNCHTSLNKLDANKINVVKVEFSGRTMRCEPFNPVTVDDSGKGFIFCYYQGDLGQDAYKTNLKIELEYGYRSSIQKEIEILKSPI